METALLTSLIAAVVALVGILVNSLISKRNQQGYVAQLHLSSKLKYNEATLNSIDSFLAQCEILRMSCRRLFKLLTDPTYGVTSDYRNYLFQNVAEQFNKQTKQLFDQWCEFRHQTSSQSLRRLEGIFWDFSNMSVCLTGSISLWTIKFDDQKKPSLEDIPEEEVKLIASQARRIFDHLSEAQEFIMKNRDGLLEEVDKIISGKTNI